MGVQSSKLSCERLSFFTEAFPSFFFISFGSTFFIETENSKVLKVGFYLFRSFSSSYCVLHRSVLAWELKSLKFSFS